MKPKNRIKSIAPALKTRADLDLALRQIAELTLNRNAILNEMDQKITAIREVLEKDIADANQSLAEKTDLVRAWAEANPSEFGKAKSLDTLHATLGWRIGQPTLKTLSGFTWDRVLEKIKAAFPAFAAYIRVKEEVNKQALIADRDMIAAQDLRALGVKIVQDESFFIDPKLTETDNRQQTEAA